MIITADWVVPMNGHPIAGGAVRVHGTHISDVATAERIRRAYPEERTREYPGCIICPGLINAHTHLSLTALAGLLASQPFPAWLSSIARLTRVLDADDFAASAAHGALLCLRSGVTSVGDVAYGPEASAAAGDAGVGGVFFWEVLGIGTGELEARLAALDFPEDTRACGTRTRCGLTPHAPYTSGPSLIRAVHALARERDVPVMIHVAESRAEVRLLTSGTGPLASVAARLAPDLSPPGSTPVEYLHSLGALDDVIAVHCVHLASGDQHLLARHARGVVLCPRSNRYLENGTPPVAALMDAGARLAVGTDSLASVPTLDIFDELRAVRTACPTIAPERLLAMVTTEAAGVLGLVDRNGTIAPGALADLIVVAAGWTQDPYAALVERGSADAVRLVMSAGVLRVIDGEPAFRTASTERASARVAEKARQALEASA